MDAMTLAQAVVLSEGFDLLPVWRRIPAAGRSTADLFLACKNVSRQCFILESAEDASRYGRYTFIGFDPELEITAQSGEIQVKSSVITRSSGNPSQTISEILAQNRAPRIEGLPPFTGGLVGYFSYEYIKYPEPQLRWNSHDDEGFRDVDLMLFNKVVAFDHLNDEIILIINVPTDAVEENFRRAEVGLDSLEQLISTGEKYQPQPLELLSEFRARHSAGEYCAMVERAKEYIHEGDIFQVVLSNRYDADSQGSLFNTYQILSRTNPSPYMLYFSSDDIEIAGSAPETLVSVTGRTASTYPLAGTRPRGATPDEDQELATELLADPKEIAEHNMLVDLGRNDLGKICEFGSVNVIKYMEIERFSHVMHIGSKVSGTLREEFGGIDAVQALLPAGTLSGAPKIRAVEIIEELEQCRRGVYGGAFGYLGFNGDLDVCIAIRLAIKKNGRVFVRSGAGIVADSVPENEHQECLNKMRAVMNALTEAAEECVR